MHVNSVTIKLHKKGNLTKHVQNKHEDPKFVCDQCVQKFQSKSALDTHYYYMVIYSDCNVPYK